MDCTPYGKRCTCKTLDELAVEIGEADPEWFINDVDGNKFGVKEYDDVFALNENLNVLQSMDSYEQKVVEAYCSFYSFSEAIEKVEAGDFVFYNDMDLRSLAEEVAEIRFNEDKVSRFYMDHFDYESLATDLYCSGYMETQNGVIYVG